MGDCNLGKESKLIERKIRKGIKRKKYKVHDIISEINKRKIPHKVGKYGT
jgi:hypothetical protein